MMRTANPALSDKIFQAARYEGTAMTIQGTVNKTGILLLLCVATAAWTWKMFFESVSYDELGRIAGADSAAVNAYMIGGLLGGLVFAFITIFKKTWAPVTAPIYALCEGLFLGGISAVFEMQFSGIVLQAVGLTFGTLFCLLLAYKSGVIKATENFKLGVTAATGAIFLLYLVTWVLSLFGANVGFLHSSGPVGILFSVVVVVIAALNLVMDFDFIENGAARGAPKFMEWYGAFGLLVTLVWLYLEILRLLAKLNSRK